VEILFSKYGPGHLSLLKQHCKVRNITYLSIIRKTNSQLSQNLLFNLEYSLFFTQNTTKFRISSFDPSGTSTINSPFPSSVFKPMRYKQIKYKLNNASTARLLPACQFQHNVKCVFLLCVWRTQFPKRGGKRSEGDVITFQKDVILSLRSLTPHKSSL